MKRRIPSLDRPVSRRRVLTAHERELWHSHMGEGPLTETSEPEPEPDEVFAVTPAKKPAKKKVVKPQALDRGDRSKIHKGKSRIDATLDLHGFTVEVAYHMLLRFITQAQGETGRVVLVITGKGRAPQSGILRTQLPHWLELPPLSALVSGFGPAGRTHGGDGAWYVRIRKRGVKV